MQRRIVLSGILVAAFVVTLAFSSWHNGLWHSGIDLSAGAKPLPARGNLAPLAVPPPAPGPSPQTPQGAAAMKAAPAAPSEAQAEPQNEQNVNPGVDIEAVRRDRGVQHGSGAN